MASNGALTTVYLPGAGGLASFWRPITDIRRGPSIAVEYPGFGTTPVVPTVRSLSELYAWLLPRLPPSFDLVAQSMGGVLALQMAIEHPERVRRLVLTATSGGVDAQALGASEWRRDAWVTARAEMPRWFIDDRTDCTDRLPAVRAPTLLVFGDADPIAPVRVGEFLRERIPHARLHVIAGGTHDLAIEVAAKVAALIDEHVKAP